MADLEVVVVPEVADGAGSRQLNAADFGVDVLEQVRDGTDSQRQLFDYYDTGGSNYEIRYLGLAPQGSDVAAAVWTVRRLSHQTIGGQPKIVDIQTLVGAWDARAALAWD